MSKLISLLLSLGTLLGGISLQADGFRGHAKLFYGPRQDAFTVSSSPKLFGEFRVLGQRSYEQGGVTFDYAYALMWSEYDLLIIETPLRVRPSSFDGKISHQVWAELPLEDGPGGRISTD